jgi:hypothetical protein
MSWQQGLILVFSFFSLLGGIACAVEYHQRRKLNGILRAPQRETIRHAYTEHAHAVGNLRGIK